MSYCQKKIELSRFQLIFLISLSVICICLALFGWFRTIDPVIYGRLSSSQSKSRSTSRFFTHGQTLPYLDEIGSPPRLNQPDKYIQWTILQMNDVYELIPLSGGKKGGLARVATIRKLLLEENSHTITILSGDVVSPSALGILMRN